MVSFFCRVLKGLRIVFFHTARWFLRYLDFISPRKYMAAYNKLLVSYGVCFTGVPRYISTKVKFDDFPKIFIGERVVISENVILLTHDYSLTTGLISIGSEPQTDVAFIKEIHIGNNVFVGMGSIILPGSNIGDNVIIGAGTVVRGNIPSNSIVMGNPGKVVSELTYKANIWKHKVEFESVRVD